MVDDYMINKVLDTFNGIIDIKKIDDTKILMNTDDKLSDDITLKRVMILMTRLLKQQ